MKNGEKKMRIRDRLETIVKAAIASEAESLKEINDVLNLIIKKQDKLNKELAGENYAKTLTTTAGLPINYGDCIMSETDEIQNSIPWKHWKAGSFNKANLNTEIIDLFHFAPIQIKINTTIFFFFKNDSMYFASSAYGQKL